MPPRSSLFPLVLLLFAGVSAFSQTRVRTERIAPPAAVRGPSAAAGNQSLDLAQLPAAVARTRQLILAAARSGDLDKLVTVMQMNETMPIFTSKTEPDPVAAWKSAYPNSEELEVLAILSQLLETGYTRIDLGTPQEMYVWPYLAHVPLAELTPEQRIDLLKIVTGADYKAMREGGTYSFYRVGIAPDGTWHYFVSVN